MTIPHAQYLCIVKGCLAVLAGEGIVCSTDSLLPAHPFVASLDEHFLPFVGIEVEDPPAEERVCDFSLAQVIRLTLACACVFLTHGIPLYYQEYYNGLRATIVDALGVTGAKEAEVMRPVDWSKEKQTYPALAAIPRPD